MWGEEVHTVDKIRAQTDSVLVGIRLHYGLLPVLHVAFPTPENIYPTAWGLLDRHRTLYARVRVEIVRVFVPDLSSVHVCS